MDDDVENPNRTRPLSDADKIQEEYASQQLSGKLADLFYL